MTIRWLPTVVFVAFAGAAAAQSAPSPLPDLAAKMQSGLWAQTIRPKANGTARPERRSERCLGPADFGHVGKLFSNDRPDNPECKPGAWVRDGSTARQRTVCNGHGVSGVADVSFTLSPPNRYTGAVKTTSTLGGRTIENVVDVEGVRVGDCRK